MGKSESKFEKELSERERYLTIEQLSHILEDFQVNLENQEIDCLFVLLLRKTGGKLTAFKAELLREILDDAGSIIKNEMEMSGGKPLEIPFANSKDIPKELDKALVSVSDDKLTSLQIYN